MKKISMILPVYHNEGSLLPSYHSIIHEIEKLEIYDYEFIFINDGSKDGSLDELFEVKKLDPQKVTIINFSRNFGQFAALNAGLNHAKGDYMIGISADQQDPPENIPLMMEKVENGADIVIAVRKARNDSFIKNITAKVHVWLIRLSTKNYPKGGFDGWLLNRKAVEGYKKYEDIIRSNQIDILNLGFRTEKIYYERKEREFGESQYNFRKRLKISINQILATSSWPLKMVSVIGFLTTIIGFLYGLRIIWAYFTKGTPFVGYAPIILLQLLIGGIIMMMLGVIGEYQWRIYYEAKKRPLFIIDEVFD